MASDCSTVSVAVFVVVAPHWAPIFCYSQTRLWPLLVQTQGTQLLKLFIQLYYNNSHQQYEKKVSHSLRFTISMFTNQHVNQYSQNRHKRCKKTKIDNWGSYTTSGSESTEREQTPCSTHLIRVYLYT